MSLSINITQHNIPLPLCCVSQFINYYAEWHYAECRYAECLYAEYHYAECRYAECHGAVLLLAFVLDKSFV
jgi:hypothetical protein